MKKGLCCFAILFLAIFRITGQDYYFKHYDADDGLSRNTVVSTLLSEKGFLWVGTKDGLNRFDGHRFRVFRNQTDNPKSLGSNYIESLHEYGGKLWVGTDIGLFAYDESDDTFCLVSTTSSSLIRDIENDRNGNIWYISSYTLFKYNPTTKKTYSYDTKTYFYAEEIARTENGDLWVAYEDVLYHYNDTNDTFETLDVNFPGLDKGSLRISKLFSLNANTLLLGTESHGLFTCDIVSDKVKPLASDKLGTLFVRDVILKDKKELWIASESGLYIYNLRSDEIQHLEKNLGDPYSLSDNAVYSITLDNENGIWVGTYFGGLNYLPQHSVNFKKYFPQLNTNSLSGNAVREIKSDDFGNLWIGTEDGGLNKLNGTTNLFTNYRPGNKSNGLSYTNIHALLPRGEELWIGTFEHGLDVMDIPSGKIKKHFGKGEINHIGSNFILSFCETDSQLLAATSAGIHIYNEKKDEFVTHKSFPKEVFFTCILEDDKKTIWAGSFGNGLYNYNPKTDETIVYKNSIYTTTSISSNIINGIFQDQNKRIWICTEEGLYQFREATNDFQKFTTENGFPSNVFYSALEDNNNHLWISTSNGLVDFDPERETVKVYKKAHGLLSNQFNYSSCYKKEDGTLFFGSIGGMISFRPTEIDTSASYIPPLYLTDLQINTGVAVDNKSARSVTTILEKPKVSLEPNQSSFSISFASLSYTAPELTEYWYRLGNQSDEWIYLQNTPEVNFNALPAGDYSLDIKSKNINGIISEIESPLELEVLPTIWHSKLAYAIYFLLLLLLGYLLFNYFHLKSRAKNYRILSELNRRRDKEVFQAKIEFFTNVSHEIRTPLTLIKTPLEKLLQRPTDDIDLRENLSLMEKNTSRLLNLTNQLLDFRKAEIETNSLTFVNTNISELIRSIYTRFSQALKDKALTVTLHLTDNDIYAYVDVEALSKVISNLFSNAIKYGERKITITLSKNNGQFEISVATDGYLIPSHLSKKIFEPFFRGTEKENLNQSGTGLGLSLASSLAELHNGELYLDTANGDKNNFVLRIPIRQEKEIDLYEPVNADYSYDTFNNKKSELVEGMKSTIVVVEDNLDLLDFIAKDLNEDYLVLKAMNADQALEIIKMERINLIVTDVLMPGMSGFDFCSKIKSEIETSHIPVILLTVKTALNAKLTGLEHGADAYIEKPFSMAHLKIQIANLLENRIKIISHYSSSPLAHIRSMAHTEIDESFIEKLENLIHENLSNTDLNVDSLAEQMNMSRSTFYRKIKDLSNLNPNELVNVARLKKAVELLGTGTYKIYEVADMVGYKSQSSFGRNFQKQFDTSPSEYMKKMGK